MYTFRVTVEVEGTAFTSVPRSVDATVDLVRRLDPTSKSLVVVTEITPPRTLAGVACSGFVIATFEAGRPVHWTNQEWTRNGNHLSAVLAQAEFRAAWEKV